MLVLSCMSPLLFVGLLVWHFTSTMLYSEPWLHIMFGNGIWVCFCIPLFFSFCSGISLHFVISPFAFYLFILKSWVTTLQWIDRYSRMYSCSNVVVLKIFSVISPVSSPFYSLQISLAVSSRLAHVFDTDLLIPVLNLLQILPCDSAKLHNH